MFHHQDKSKSRLFEVEFKTSVFVLNSNDKCLIDIVLIVSVEFFLNFICDF